MNFQALLQALKTYQTFNPSGWVSLYKLLPMYAGIACGVLGLLMLLFGGGKVLFRIVAGPIGALMGYLWTPVVIAKLGLSDVDPRMPSIAAAVLLVLGFLFPPAVTFVGVGLPVGLLAGQIAGQSDFLLGFAPGLIIGGLVGALLHRVLSSVVASVVGAWLLVIGALAALHQFGGVVAAVASQPWGVIIAAVLFAIAGSVYQIAVRPSPEEQEKLRAEREQRKLREAEQRRLEKRWGVK
jgi:hypothetical protein